MALTQVAGGMIASGQTIASPTLTTPTLTSPTINGTPVMGTSVITSGVAQASTSGTAIQFTGIPSWCKRITIMLNGVSTNGISLLIVQIGSGSYTTSGYQSNARTNTSTSSATNGLQIDGGSAAAAFTRCGIMTLANLGSNIWAMSCTWGDSVNANQSYSGGVSPALGGALDRLQIVPTNGTDTFDAGSINILYE